MGVFAIRIGLPQDVTVQSPHNADKRHHGGSVILDDQKQHFNCGLPLREILLRLRKLLDVLGASSRVTSWRPRGSGIGSSNGRFQLRR
jgi:hypothetical protein